MSEAPTQSTTVGDAATAAVVEASGTETAVPHPRLAEATRKVQSVLDQRVQQAREDKTLDNTARYAEIRARYVMRKPRMLWARSATLTAMS